jgi:CRP/FNR family transcriptional regulator
MVERQPDFARRLLRLAADELVATRDHLLCVAAKSAEGKMAAFLLALAERNAQIGRDQRRIELLMTRIDIGDYLGLTIETVSRTLSKLKRANIIGLPQTNLVVIHDVARLRQIALS